MAIIESENAVADEFPERDFAGINGTVVDPRLNCEQALEMAMHIARRMKPEKRAST